MMKAYHVPEDRFLTDQIFYVTMSLLDRNPRFQDPAAAKVVYESLRFFRQRTEIELFAYVIMPDHFHVMLRPLPPLILPKWARRFKTFTTHEITGGKPIWMTSYWSEIIVSAKFLYQKMRYIHANPVRAGLVERPEDYNWSSAREYATGELVLVTPL